MALSTASVSRGIARALMGVALLVAALLGAGAVYQSIAEVRDRAVLEPPGQLVQVGGHVMHIHCSGRMEGPTVVLEAGATGFAQTWAWVQSELSTSVRVCSYDRAGLGWSDAWDTGHDPSGVASNLRALLNAVEEPAPYVLVGHGLGARYVMAFAEAYPEAVAGVVLVDPSALGPLGRSGAVAAEEHQEYRSTLGWAAKLAHFGVLRVTDVLARSAAGLPEEDYQAARLFGASPRHLAASLAELETWDGVIVAAGSEGALGDVPLAVVSATGAGEGGREPVPGATLEAHAELAALSSRGEHVRIEHGDRHSLLIDEPIARKTGAVIAEIVEYARILQRASYTP